MKKLGFSTFLLLLTACSCLFSFACRNDRNDYGESNKIPARMASMAESDDYPPALSFSTGLDNPYYLAGTNGNFGYYYVETKAVASSAMRPTKRLPLNLSLVIDRSGSMAGDKLVYAKRAANHVINQLSPEDYVSIVIYGNNVEVLATSNKVGDKWALQSRIDAIQPSGSTNLHGGMMAGYAQVKSTYQTGYVNRVLMLSDGQANVGIVDIGTLQSIAREQVIQNNITISCFGLGLDFNENLMTGIAEFGSGNYYFIHHPSEITGIFQKELSGLTQVVAQNTELHIDLPAGVVLQRVFGFPYTQIGQRVTVQLRDFAAGETKGVLLKFQVFGNNQSHAFHVQLQYVDALTSDLRRRLQASHDVLTPTASIEEMGRSFNPTIKSQVVLFESNDNLEQAMRAVDSGQYEQARALVKANDSYLNDNMGYVKQSTELQAQMSNNTSYQTQITNVEALSSQDIQLLQKSNKATNYEVRRKR
jgi:Ca-activated chloride channel family protein